AAAFLSLIIWYLPSDWQVMKASALFGILIFSIILYNNPATRYMKSFWVVLSIFTVINIFPSLELTTRLNDKLFFKFLSQGPNAIISSIVGIIMIVLLILDWVERRK
ncbi:hypothetical protein QUF61_07780, partial [Candidatus Venteria ishoeyi]|uniref:hypothetical protein n=1 Tax=Candidatus Venteria ishoeyi TaxID=1899563 RepID=UPI0025A54212